MKTKLSDPQFWQLHRAAWGLLKDLRVSLFMALPEHATHANARRELAQLYDGTHKLYKADRAKTGPGDTK